MIIYKATNIVNNKSYIGQSINSLKVRKASHKCAALKDSNSYFHKAIRKYGWDLFIWEILYECNSIEELDSKETELILLHETHYLTGKGYNITKGGDYHPMSNPETKIKADINRALAMKNFMGDNNVMKRPEIKEKHNIRMKELALESEWINAKAMGTESILSTYEVTFPDGHTEIIKGLSNFCKEYSLSQPHMSSVANGNRPHHKKFKCKLLDRIKSKSDPFKHKR
jgi:group I intron endonuclease